MSGAANFIPPPLSGLQFAHFIPECIAAAAAQIGLTKPTSVTVSMGSDSVAEYGANESLVRAVHAASVAEVESLSVLIGSIVVPDTVAGSGVSLIATLVREFPEKSEDGLSLLWKIRSTRHSEIPSPAQLSLF